MVKNSLLSRPQHVFHYIQWDELTPDFVVDITGFLAQKMDAILAFKSQFYDGKNEGHKHQ